MFLSWIGLLSILHCAPHRNHAVSSGEFDQIIAKSSPEQQTLLQSTREQNQQADTLYAEKNYVAAIELYTKILTVYENILGTSHPATLNIRNNYASCLYLVGKENEAITILETMRAQHTLPPSHPISIQTKQNLSNIYSNNQENEKAIALLEEIWKEQRKHVRKNPQFLDTLEDLADAYIYVHDLHSATRHLHTLYRLQKREFGSHSPETISSLLRLAEIARKQNHIAKSQDKLHRAEKYATSIDPAHPIQIDIQRAQAALLSDMGQTQHAVEIYQQILEKSPVDISETKRMEIQTNLATLYVELGQTDKAEPILLANLEYFSTNKGNAQLNSLSTKENLAYVYNSQARTQEAEFLFLDVLQISTEVYGTDHPHTMTARNNLGDFYLQNARYDKAEKILLEAVESKTRVLGPNHPDTLISKGNLGNVYVSQSRYPASLEIFTQILEAQESSPQIHLPNIITTRNNIGNVYVAQGKYEDAFNIFKANTEQSVQLLGSTHPITLASQSNLAYATLCLGQLDAAKKLYLDIIFVQQTTLGEHHPKTLRSISALGKLYISQGLQKEGEELLLKAQQDQESILGLEHPDTLNSLNELANLYESMGEYDKAEPILLQLIEIKSKVFGKTHPSTLNSYTDITNLYISQGRYDEAELLGKFNVEASEKILGTKHPNTLYASQSLANVYQAQKNDEKALGLFEQSYHISVELLTEKHAITLQSLSSLAQVEMNLGKLEQAKEHFEQTLALQEQILGAEHPSTLITSNNVANLYQQLGENETALSLLEKNFTVQQRTLGKNHPNTLTSLYNLTTVCIKLHKIDKAIEYATLLSQGQQQFLQNNFTGSEQSRQDFFTTFTDSTNLLISLHQEYAPNNEKARDLAINTIIQRQGKVLDAQIDTLQRIRDNMDVEGQTLLAKLQQLQLKESQLIQHPPQSQLDAYHQELQYLSTEITNIQRTLSQKSQEYSVQHSVPDVQNISVKLPTNTALIQYVLYKNPIGSSPNTTFLAAYTIFHDGTIHSYKLEKIPFLDETLQAFRQTRSSALGKKLYNALIAPLDLPANTSRILIAPDGLLHITPFELFQRDNEYLVDLYTISYLSALRDIEYITHQKSRKKPTTPPVVFANPNYSNSAWGNLQATENEARLVQSIYPNSQSFLGNDANIDNIHNINTPSILHIASHGFSVADDPLSIADNNPMYRSGLVLADPNNNGILLASEAVYLPLDGTDLVVLSACETGLGQVHNGDGVYGLRRAFTLAGAHSQIVSLWPVNDKSTAVFMELLYTELAKGTQVSDALRTVKLQLKADGYDTMVWASFMLTGDWE